MAHEEKNRLAESDDIDLLLLIEKIVLFFKKFIWVFVVAIIVGISTGYYFYRLQPKVYTSRLIAHSFMLSNQEEIQIIDNWNQLLGRHEYASMAALFKCDEKLLYPVRQIKADEIQKVFTPPNPNGFTIEVTTTDISILDSLEYAIVNGLERNGYVKQRTDFKVAALNDQIKNITAEIKRLDSTRTIVENLVRNNQRAAPLSDLSGLNQQLMTMNEKLMLYKEQAKFSNSIQILQSFGKFKTPTGPKLFVWLFMGLVFWLTIAFAYAFIRTVNTMMKRHAEKKY
ncbi:MAG: hypothetical protein QM764_12705 [Chitinophagaceae bacterium]